jgi:hypothetical protein
MLFLPSCLYVAISIHQKKKTDKIEYGIDGGKIFKFHDDPNLLLKVKIGREQLTD